LFPLQPGEAFTFCHGRVKPSEKHAAEIRKIAESRGAAFIQIEHLGRYAHCLAVPAAIAEADPFLAGDLVIDLANAGLMVPAYDCVKAN